MKFQFIYGPELEYERLLLTLEMLDKDIYQEHEFLVLPYRLPLYHKSVYLPKIKNFQPDKYRKEFRTLMRFTKPTDLKEIPEATKVINAIKKSGFKPEKIDKEHTEAIQKRWYSVKSQFEDYFLDLFPQYRQRQIEAEIIWTRYGTLVSYRPAIFRGKSIKTKIFLRDDMGIDQIAEGFLSSFFRAKWQKNFQFSWLQQEAIVDFLLTETKLNRLFSRYFPTLKQKPKNRDSRKHLKRSDDYLKELGFAFQPKLSSERGKILVNGQIPQFAFSPTEEKVLAHLLKTPNKAIDYYDLGDVIWGDDPDQFSLWALSRMIYKIRNKLHKNGLSPNHIKNLRGQGYFYTPEA